MHVRGGAQRACFCLLLMVLLAQTSCLLSPVRWSPSVEGQVVDGSTGKPVGDAVVVLRFDGRYDDVLPDRDVLGHTETRTDASGHFEVGRSTYAGLTAYPYFKVESRVVAVYKDGYRCADPRPVRGRSVRVPLTPALDEFDQRDSCRPVPARPGDAAEYMTAWRDLHATEASAEIVESDRQIDRLLEARSVFGFGENCEGPISDLALSPGGARAAFLAARGDALQVRLIELRDGAKGASSSWTPARLAGSEERWPPRRLAWTSPDRLVLWEPVSELRRTISSSVLTEEPELVWQAAAPAAPDPGATGSGAAGSGAAGRLSRIEMPATPMDPADLNDEGDTRWAGRSFSLVRNLDPVTGLSADRLSIVRENGRTYQIPLPGESCGPRGRFGRPHHRIASDGLTAVDLRFVENGCHVVSIDLETGRYAAVDGVGAAAMCTQERTVPASSLAIALRSYMREVTAIVNDAGADPAAAFVLHIEDGGRTRIATRDFAGEPRRLDVPDFPLETPLRRIDVSGTGGAVPTPRPTPIMPAEPMIEPL